jgi:hypothetical protein
MSCGDLDSGGSSAVIGLDDREGTQRWRFVAADAPYAPGNVELTTSPDGRTTAYEPTGTAPTLLASATGTVLHRAGPDDVRIVAPDARTPVLARHAPGARDQLVVRDLGTGAEHPLASTCPVLRRSDEPDDPGELITAVRVVVTAASVVVVLCEGGPITAYSRTDGAETANLAGPVGRRDPTTEPELLPAPGAIVLVVRDHDGETAAVSGLA